MRHRWQSILALVGISIGIAVTTSIDTAITSSQRAFQLSGESVSGKSTHQIVSVTAGLPEEEYAKLRLAGFDHSAPVVEGTLRSGSRQFQVLGVDPFSEPMFRQYMEAKVEHFSLNGKAFVILHRSLQRDYSAGDQIEFIFSGKRKTALVSGFFAFSTHPEAGKNIVLTDISVAQNLVDMQGKLSRIDLILENPEEEIKEVQNILGKEINIESSSKRQKTLASISSAFETNLRALSLMALVVGAFLIYNTMNFSIVQRRPLFATLRSLGVYRSEIFRLVLFESAILALIGTLAGIALGFGLAQGLIRLIASTINDMFYAVEVSRLSLTPLLIAKALLLGFTVTIVSALFPAIEASRSAPGLARLRSGYEKQFKRQSLYAIPVAVLILLAATLLFLFPGLNLFFSFFGLFLVIVALALLTPATIYFITALTARIVRTPSVFIRYAIRSSKTSLSRLGPAVAALMIAVSVTVSIGLMIGSFRGTILSWLKQTLVADVYVAPADPSPAASMSLPDDFVNKVLNIDGIESWSLFRATFIETKGIRFRLIAPDFTGSSEEEARSAFTFVRSLSDPWKKFHEGAVFVSESFVQKYGYDVSSGIEMPNASGKKSYLIAGVFRDYASQTGTVMITGEQYRKDWQDDHVTSIGLFLKEGVSADDIAQQVLARAGDDLTIQAETTRTLKELAISIFDKTFAITSSLRILAMIVAFVGILSSLLALILERNRENAILRSLGATPGQIAFLTLLQSIFFGLLAGALAIPSGILLARLLVEVINVRSFGWSMPLILSTKTLLQTFAIALIPSLVAAIYPAIRAGKTNLAAALKEE